MTPLTYFKKGEVVRLIHFEGGSHFIQRLLAMGMYQGAEVEVIKNDYWGPIVIKVFEARLAIGRGAAFKIYGEKK